jgi:hypothetical protein
VDEVGGEVCKNYASGVYPDDGSVLDSLTEPDSPPQFHGRFDVIPFTTSTVPAVSHYKVFYHIYAGEDSRAYYQVYLKSQGETAYYLDSPIRYIDSGYIGKGDYVSETEDFTAPVGYTKLCIRVNNQEECGFKEVSTSFAVDYVTDKYAEDIAEETDISSEKECVSGNPNLYSLTNVNLQSAAEEIVNPEIYKRGIIRICADRNPGIAVDAGASSGSARWVDVGWCDKVNGIKCWLDKDSVKESIELKGIQDSAMKGLEEITEENLKRLREQGDYMSEEEYKDLVNKISGSDKPDHIIKLVNDKIDRAFWDYEKARLYLERGKAYASLALGDEQVKGGEAENGGIDSSSSGSGGGKEEFACANYNFDYSRTQAEVVKAVKSTTNVSSECEKYLSLLYDRGNFKFKDSIPDPFLLIAIMQHENNACQVGASDGLGSFGLMQVHEDTFNDVCKDKIYGVESFEDIKGVDNVAKNIECGVMILKNKKGYFYFSCSSVGCSHPFFGDVSNNRDTICDSSNKCGFKYKCDDEGVYYCEWEAALRAYNGWSCILSDGSNANDKYVEDIMKIYEDLVSKYGSTPIA